MEKEALEVITAAEDTISVEYEQPNFAKRCFANLLDFIFYFLAFIGFFIASSKSVQAMPFYRNADAYVATVRKNSGLYEYSFERKTWENISTYLDNNNDASYGVRVNRCITAISAFQTYMKDYVTEEKYQAILTNYDTTRLSSKMIDTHKLPLFIKIEARANPDDPIIPYTEEDEELGKPYEIIHNPESTASSQYYYTKYYREYTLVNCEGYMVSCLPKYQSDLKIMSSSLFYIEIPVALFLGAVLIYLVPGFIFKRGRMTFGKKLMSIGLVDSRILSPTIPRFIARWAIFFVGEVVLSIFTFGVPLIVSFSMMAFTKNKQGFPDYMLGLIEVDENKQKIYMNRYEIGVEKSIDHKDPVRFKLIDGE